MAALKGRPNLLDNLQKTFFLVWNASWINSTLLFVSSIILGLIPTAQVWITKLLIDKLSISSMVLGHSGQVTEPLKQVITLIILEALLFLLGELLSIRKESLSILLGEKLRNLISVQILEKANNIEYSNFEDPSFHDRMQNAFQEASSRPLNIITQLFTEIQLLATLITGSFMIIRLDWFILVVLFIVALPVFFVQNKFGMMNYWMLRSRAPNLRKQSYIGMLLTSDRFIKELRVYGIEKYFLAKYKDLFSKFYSETKTFTGRRSRTSSFTVIGQMIGWIVCITLVILHMVKGELTNGDFILYIQLVTSSQQNISAILSGFSRIFSDSLFIRNLYEFIAIPSDPKNEEKEEWNEEVNEIEFVNVSFRYPNTERMVLKNINFTISRNQSVGLVGLNGAGKTTLVKLICRLYEPTCGQVLYNGKPVNSYSASSIQQKISILFQDYASYCLSVKDNIGLGRVSSINEDTQISKAAEEFGVDQFAEKLPHGMDTQLGKIFEGGSEISGGEWQKIALARSYFRNGDVVIMDEPTAALDAQAEYNTLQSITKKKTNHIMLFISHRFSTMRLADSILFLENGQIIESGTHNDLVKKGGKYASLFELQAEGYKLNIDE